MPSISVWVTLQDGTRSSITMASLSGPMSLVLTQLKQTFLKDLCPFCCVISSVKSA